MDERRSGTSRRASDNFKIWGALILSLATTLLSLGIAYGALRARHDAGAQKAVTAEPS